VTGASRGIGAETAKALGAAGAHVILTARTTGALEEVEEAIHAAGGSATIAPLDLTDGESIGRLAGAVTGRWQALDYLVLNAATLGSLASVPAIDAKELARLLTLNIGAQQGDHRCLRPDASRQQRCARCGRYFLGRRKSARLLGRLCRVQGGAGHIGRLLWRGNEEYLRHPHPYRRSRRDPHRDARAGLSG
jgi:NAD(P)-dependent dehydrogenase (short-subunit alcohol dehydrogenase family)